MENAQISTGTISHLGGDGAEEFAHCVLILEVAEHNTTVVRSIFLALCHQRFEVRLEGLGLRHGCGDALVLDQGRSHVGEHCLAVPALAAEMIDCFIVSHR